MRETAIVVVVVAGLPIAIVVSDLPVVLLAFKAQIEALMMGDRRSRMKSVPGRLAKGCDFYTIQH